METDDLVGWMCLWEGRTGGGARKNASHAPGKMLEAHSSKPLLFLLVKAQHIVCREIGEHT